MRGTAKVLAIGKEGTQRFNPIKGGGMNILLGLKRGGGMRAKG